MEKGVLGGIKATVNEVYYEGRHLIGLGDRMVGGGDFGQIQNKNDGLFLSFSF